jgi:hypothetical protein
VEDVTTNIVSDNLPTDVVSNKVSEYKDTLVIDDENDIPNLQYLDLGHLQHHKKMSYFSYDPDSEINVSSQTKKKHIIFHLSQLIQTIVNSTRMKMTTELLQRLTKDVLRLKLLKCLIVILHSEVSIICHLFAISLI